MNTEDEFSRRFKAAKNLRQTEIADDGRAVYKFAFNGREREWDNGTKATQPEEIFASDVATIAEDFYGELFHTMTPENQAWVEYETGSAIPEDAAAEVKREIETREDAIEKALRASNYYDEGTAAFAEAVIGNVSMWVERPTLSGAIVCEAVPTSELFLRVGPNGIEDRFRVKSYEYRDLEMLFPGANFPKDIRDKMKGNGRAKVTWGFWRDYSDRSNPIWLQRIRVDGKAIGLDEELGPDGSCPLVTGRFNPMPNSPWGRGPGRRLLPDIRVLDELIQMNLENIDKNVDPAIIYPNDGILDLSDGIEAGMGYPSSPGSADSIRAIGIDGNLDYGFFTQENLTMKLKEGFYQAVDQRGKTPPSATQFMGQEQRQLRRIARPAGKLWSEFGVGMLKRIEFLEVESGALQGMEPITHNGQIVTIRPISPLERAQARDEVIAAQSILEMSFNTLGPEQTALLIDGPKTIKNIQKALKDDLVAVRTEEQLEKAAEMAAQMQQGAQVEPAQT